MNWSDARFAAIAGLLADTAGFDFPELRREFAEAAIGRAMAAAHERDPGVYLARLTADRSLLDRLIGEAVVGETYFFRERAQFDVLRTMLLPQLRARSEARPVRVWSAGCASGEEPYSLAIAFDADGVPVRILASDVSSAAIAAAKRGHYGAWSFRDGGEAWRDRCFFAAGRRWAIEPRLREQVTFAVHNLMDPPPTAFEPGTIDLILCRNVLIYLTPDAVRRVADRLVAALAPGGWLVTSSTDPLLSREIGLDHVMTEAGIIYRRAPVSAPAFVPAYTVAPVAAAPAPRPAAIDRPRSGVRHAAPERALDPQPFVSRALQMLDLGLPFEASVAARKALFVDRTLAIAHLTLGRAMRLLGNDVAARRALLRGRMLLADCAAGDPVRCANGTSAGSLAAVATAELSLLGSAGRPR